MTQTKYRHLRKLETQTERYVLIGENGVWHAEMRTLMDDGSWHTAWFSAEYPNERGAFEAVKESFNFEG